MRQGWIALVVCLLIGLVGVAHADTGGRMGGGSWSSSSSSHSSSSSGWSHSSSSSGWSSSRSSSSWSSSHDYGHSYSSYNSSGGSGLPGGALLIIGGIVVLGFIIFFFASQSSSYTPSYIEYDSSYFPSSDSVDVSVLRIALDGRARKFVQTELARIAKVADTSTEDGRATMLREVGLLLRRVRDAWVYGGAVNEPMRDIGAAKPVFDKHVDDARMKFREETVSNVQGVKTGATASEYIPRSEEGAGVILVTIVVAARGELFTVAHIGDGEDLRKALEAASHREASDLVAIEIIWQPSEETDRMSSLELEAKYPRPALIPIQGALVGKTFCAYCGGPFPAELVTCPHCGGSAAEPRAA